MANEPVLPPLADGLVTGIGFTLAFTAIGAVGEVLGAGTLFADAARPLGPAFKFMELCLLPEHMGVLMMILPPGRFLVTGLLVVAKRMVDVRAGKPIQMAGTHSAGQGRAMKVSVVYANPKRQFWTTLDLPEIDLATQKVGVFSKVVALAAPLEDGDRVEIYRPLIADPKTIQARAKAKGKVVQGDA